MNEAYLQFLERQAARGLGPLPDHKNTAEREQRDFAHRHRLSVAFGEWVALDLGPWDWFINPITFRDRHPELERNQHTGTERRYRSTGSVGAVKLYVNDPRLKGWEPDFRGRRNPGPPVPDKALAELNAFFLQLQDTADRPIRVMIAEEFGRLGGRYHAHALVAGVAHASLDDAWAKAFEQFGRTRISMFDPRRGGVFYAAKYASKQLGAIHFLGTLPGAEFNAKLQPPLPVGRVDVLRSAEMTRDDFRRNDAYPQGWSVWRSKR